jgi:hypothetical protein
LFLVVLLAAIVWLAVTLVGELSGSDDSVEPPSVVPSDAGPGAPTRTERRALAAELEQIERDLDFARDQARMALDADTREAWQTRVTALVARREEVRAALDR